MPRSKYVLKGTWEDVCKQAYDYALEVYEKHHIKLNLRALFYYLSDTLGVLLHTQNAYKRLSDKFARYREKIGKIDIIEDVSRPMWDYYEFNLTPINEIVKRKIEWLIDSLSNYVWKVPRWYFQDYYLAIWIEKEKVIFIEDLAREYEIDALPTKGFSSITKMYEATQRIIKANNLGKSAVILILTDFDPSGIFIDRDYRLKVERYGGRAEFVRVAMLPEQIERYDLPAIPHDDPRNIRIRRDRRYKSWLKLCEEMGVEPKVVELDAFVGIKPEEFRNLIISHIEKYWSEEKDRKRVEEEEKRREEVEKIISELKKRLSDLF